MVEFHEVVLSNNDILNLKNNYTWDSDFNDLSNNHICLTDGATYVILSIDNNICKNILLVKKDKRMLNFYSLAEKLVDLPIESFYFNSERKLGNKYRFITELMGGIVIEEDGKYFYSVDTLTAIDRMNKKYIYQELNKYKDIFDHINDIFDDTVNSINSIFEKFTSKIFSVGIKHIYNYYHKLKRNTIDQFIISELYRTIINDENYLAIKKKTNRGREEHINSMIDSVIKKKVALIIEEIEKYANDIYNEFLIIVKLKFDYYSEVYNYDFWYDFS